MKRISNKRRQYLDEIHEDRMDWAASMPQRCMRCHWKSTWLSLQVHEIARKSSAPGKWAHRCNYLLLCQQCHEGPFANMDHARQLAVKLVRDPEHFDLPQWIEVIGRGPEYVTLADVAQHLSLENTR